MPRRLSSGAADFNRAFAALLGEKREAAVDVSKTAADIIAKMTSLGFSLYDIFGLLHRPADGALAQADLCFVRTDGPFRDYHYFATAEQRQALTKRLQQMNSTISAD